MILRRLASLLGETREQRIPAFLLAAVMASLFQAFAFILAVPFLLALLEMRIMDAAIWFLMLALLVSCAWWSSHRAALNGFELALALLHQVRTKVGAHLVRLPLGGFTPLKAARLSATISQGVMELLALPAHQLFPLVQALVLPPVVVAGMAFFNVTLALTAAAIFPFMALIYWWSGRLGQAADLQAQKAGEDASQRVVEFAQAQAVMRAFGLTARGQGALQEALEQQARAARRQIWMIIPPLLANSWLIQLGYLILMAMAVHLALGGAPADLPVLVVLMLLVNRILEPLGDVGASGAGIRMASAELARVEAILAEPPLPLAAPPAAPPLHWDIGFEHVRFSHVRDQVLLNDFSLSIQQNSTVALVGTSGAGKSTLLHLVARFFDVEGGRVTLGGVDVRRLAPFDLAACIAPVFQNAYLFPGSIRENVLMSRPDADTQALARVAQLTGMDDMLSRLPDGWDYQIGEGGSGLSGGERQRVCMARALLKDAPILLLDEPTSALDPESRQLMAHLLATLRGNKTILLVAHQLDWTMQADRVLVMDKGRLVEDGVPAQLLAREGFYAALYRLHAEPEGWRSTAGTC